MKEIWRDLIGFEGKYQISNKGRVRSLTRRIMRSPNSENSERIRVGGQVYRQGHMLSPLYCNGYVKYNLCNKGKYKQVYAIKQVKLHFEPAEIDSSSEYLRRKGQNK